MALRLRPQDLRSRATRQSISGSSKTRKIIFDTRLSSNAGELVGSGGGFWGVIADFAANLGGIVARFFGGLWGCISWAWQALGFPTSFSQVGQSVMNTLESLSQFNWNQTDAELKQQIEGYNTQVFGIWGEVIGRGVGYVTSIAIGAGVSIAVPVIGSKLLALRVAGAVSKEAAEEILDEVTSATRQTVNLALSSGVLRAYMSARNFIKRQDLGEIIGEKGAAWVRDKWGVEGQPDASFVRLRDEAIEKNEHKGWRNFTENFIDGWWDSLRDGVVIITRELDAEWQAAYAAARDGQGPPKALEILPDRNNDREKLLFYGRERELIPHVMGALNTVKAVDRRDIGHIGALEPETLELPELQRLRLTLVLFSTQKPPWRNDDGKRAKRVEINIPNPRRNLTWQQIKQAMGWTTGYEWGGRYAVGRFDSRRKMIVYAPEEQSARQRLQALAALSDDDLVSIQTGERVFRINESEENRRRRIRIYPAYLKSVVMRRNPTSATPGVQDLEGNTWRQHSQKINLWPDEPPWNASEIFVQEPLP